MWVQHHAPQPAEYEEVNSGGWSPEEYVRQSSQLFGWSSQAGARSWSRSEETVPLQYGAKPKAPIVGAGEDGLHKDPKHHLEEGDYAAQDKHEIQAGMAKHHCTDLLCVFVFLAALLGQGILIIYGATHGDTRRLHYGYNATGALCGVDVPDKPFVYWCQRNVLPGGPVPLGLDIRHPICVQSCPTTSFNESHLCFTGPQKTMIPYQSDGKGGYYYEETTKYSWEEVEDYPSAPYMNKYCLPTDIALKSQLMQALNLHGMTKFLSGLDQIGHAWVPLTVAVIIAVILGYMYIFILEHCAWCLVYFSIGFIVISNLVTGLFLIICQFTGGIDGIPNSGDSSWNWIAGIGMVLLAIGFGAFAICAHTQIETAVGCVQAAGECFFDMPSVLLEPCLTICVKFIVFIVLTWGFMLLASVGKDHQMTLEQAVSKYESVPGQEKSGVFRMFKYGDSQQWFMSYYIFVGVWIMCFLTALSQFVIAYAVELWYFTPYVHGEKERPECPIFRGYYIGGVYHLGSLAFGSFVVTILYILRAILSSLESAAELEGNCIMACIAACLHCCLVCYSRFIEFLNKNAYMDIAINSTTFCTGAQNALQVISSEIAAVAFLNGACWVFNIAGYGLITGVGTFLVWLMVRSLWFFNNVESSTYIHDPVAICFLAGLICFVAAVGFMHMFDMISDTMLFCFATEERRKERGLLKKDVQYAPETLNKLIQHHSDGHHDNKDQAKGGGSYGDPELARKAPAAAAQPQAVAAAARAMDAAAQPPAAANQMSV